MEREGLYRLWERKKMKENWLGRQGSSLRRKEEERKKRINREKLGRWFVGQPKA